jgi:hypothetical protein
MRTASPLQQGYLGITTVPITHSLVEESSKEDYQTGLPQSGVLIETLAPHGPGALAGLHGAESSPIKGDTPNEGNFGGDAITEVDGMPIASSNELAEIIASFKAGQIVPLTVSRAFENNEVHPGAAEETSPHFAYEPPQTISVHLGARPPQLPREKPVGEDCGSARVENARTQKGNYLHFFVTGSVACGTAVSIVREYVSRPERECGGNTCTIQLPNGWGCSSPPAATHEATGIVDECSSGSEKIAALETSKSAGSARADVGAAEASMPAECGLPPLVQHPATFAFSCDGNVVFTDVHWQHWGEATATGSGTLSELADGCTPDCASAPRDKYAVRIVASQIVLCGPRRVYSTITAYLNERDVRGQTEVAGPRFMTGSCG